MVVSNAGIDLTVELAGDEAVGAEYADRARKMQYSGSGVVAKFLLDKQLIEEPAIIYMPDAGPDDMFAFLEEGGLPDDMMMMVLVVDRMDPSSVPDGKQLIIAATPGPPIARRPAGSGAHRPPGGALLHPRARHEGARDLEDRGAAGAHQRRHRAEAHRGQRGHSPDPRPGRA